MIVRHLGSLYSKPSFERSFHISPPLRALSEASQARLEARKKLERKQILDQSASELPLFKQVLNQHGLYPLRRTHTRTLQINIGLLCNQTCHHCHVEAGPTRKAENMSRDTVDRLLHLLDHTPSVKIVDITGGAPELNPNFHHLVSSARSRNLEVIDRCNLTVLLEEGQEKTADFLASNGVTVVASLPCYSPDNVDKQRGKGVFDKSIAALQKLNSIGYGRKPELQLNLVFNPVGPSLPGPQANLERSYKDHLRRDFGIDFNQLFTITNMPIKRFADMLLNTQKYTEYMSLLVNHFNPGTIAGLMCRDTVSVSWDGRLFDCDFNQMLDIEIGASAKKKDVWSIDSFDFENENIATAKHCFGCTAGAGSSCTGALS